MTKKYFRSLNVYEIEVILTSNLTDLFEEKKTSEKGCYSLIIHAYCLVVNYWHVLRIGPTQVLRMDNLPFQAKVFYGDCMSLVKETDVNSKNKQDPNPSRYILYKDSNVFQCFSSL